MALSLGARTGNFASRVTVQLYHWLTNYAADIGTATTSDVLIFADASDNYELKYGDGDNLRELAGLNASALVETVTAANVITAAESGKTFFLDAAGGFLSTLPAPAAGLNYTFIVKTAPTSVGYTIAPNGGTADIICAGFNELEVDTTEDGPYLVDGDLVTFVANVSVGGDFLKLISDGTKWYGHGQTNADGGATIAKT